MKYPLVELLRKFIADEIHVAEFRNTLVGWTQSGLWESLSKTEHMLLEDYFVTYFDMYAGETVPRFTWWERVQKHMYGEPTIDLQALKKGSADLLGDLQSEHHVYLRFRRRFLVPFFASVIVIGGLSLLVLLIVMIIFHVYGVALFHRESDLRDGSHCSWIENRSLLRTDA
ncbi:MAG TPA: hypothetical protein VFG71_10810 [Nitrospiraceae bacterium]|nr:hypothetical protein [Nitrospiraceae bacterium]